MHDLIFNTYKSKYDQAMFADFWRVVDKYLHKGRPIHEIKNTVNEVFDVYDKVNEEKYQFLNKVFTKEEFLDFVYEQLCTDKNKNFYIRVHSMPHLYRLAQIKIRSDFSGIIKIRLTEVDSNTLPGYQEKDSVQYDKVFNNREELDELLKRYFFRLTVTTMKFIRFTDIIDDEIF